MHSVSSKFPLPSLPLPPSSHILTHNLTPDSYTPDPLSFHNGILRTKPSIQRRARLLDDVAHFSHVSPLPLAFPYRIEVDENGEDDDRTKTIEKWLAEKEALTEVDVDVGPSVFKAYSSDARVQDFHLIGVSSRGLEDCVPALDVGDAFEHLGVPSLAPKESVAATLTNGGSQSNGTDSNAVDANSVADPSRIRQVLTNILSGHTVLFGLSDETKYAPWSLRYSGHQFGSWAGQLGDGRAISILESPHPKYPGLVYELQLKGAGRTPFSRSADGLAVLRSSIREYLGAEAVHALGIPTTRSLALVLYPSLPVRRETQEKAAVVTRVAPSFIRIGNFESLNPPLNVLAFSFTGQQSAHWEGLRILGEWVSRRVLQLNLGPYKDEKPPAWGKELVMECARRNARMVAGWQVYGFMHGVINTDNVSILGLTIDYGPYAFMDVYEENHICNHTDEEGRYAYKYQPTMIIYALRALLTSLSPLIGAEIEFGHAVQAGWSDVSKDKLDDWREDGMELKQEVEELVMDTFNATYWPLMRKRLALRKEVDSDPDHLIRPLLRLMEAYQLDFHSTFRTLSSFRPSSSPAELEQFASRLMRDPLLVSADAQERAQKGLIEWLEKYAKRINTERDDWGEDMDRAREIEGRKVNPRFVLRQWVLEEVIKKVDEDHESGKRILAKVLEMASHPFESWGAEDDASGEELDIEAREERRYCGMGPKKFLGFQCSCSS